MCWYDLERHGPVVQMWFREMKLDEVDLLPIHAEHKWLGLSGSKRATTAGAVTRNMLAKGAE